MMSYSLMTTIGPHFSYCQQKKTLNKILTIPPSLPAPYRRSSIAPVVNVVGSINPEIRKNEDKVVDSVVVSELSKPLTAYCRCWRSESFPQCDGSHTKHNKATGDNIGPLLVKKNGVRKPSVAAVVPNGHLPMRSFEVKNRTSVDDIKSLRLITAIKTPYLPDGRFDLEAYDALMNTHIMNGTEGVIVGGTTGEGHLMSWDEHIMLIGHTVNCFGTRIKVIGNTGSNSTREAIHATEQGFAVGMHAALHINPYYGKTSLQGMLLHFETILSMGPTIIYNVPSRTGQDIPPSVINKISSNHNLAGIKECVGNDRIKEYVDGGMTIWSGNDDECHDARWAYGAVGVISVTSNLIPGLMHELMFEGENVSLNSKVMPLIKWLFDEPNPIGLNTALAQLGVIRPVFRLPYVPLPLSKRVEFVSIVESIGREHFVGDGDVEVLDDNDFVLVGRY